MSKTKLQKNSNNHYELIGRLDAESVPNLLRQTESFNPSENESVVINLSAVTHSSSVGIALLLEWQRQANTSQFEIQFINMPEKMRAIAEICGLTEILPIQ